MNKIKLYNTFINESLKDKLKGKSDEDIKKGIDKLLPSQKLRKIKGYNLRHLFTNEEFIDIIKNIFYTTPSYLFDKLKYSYNKLSEILSDEEIKNGIDKYAKNLNKNLLHNSSTHTLSEIIYYLYIKDYLFNNFDSTTLWFKHITKGPYSGGHISVNGYTELEDIINYVERMEKLDY